MSDNAVTIPDWLVALVGRLTIENEVLRRQLEAQAQQPPTSPGTVHQDPGGTPV